MSTSLLATNSAAVVVKPERATQLNNQNEQHEQQMLMQTRTDEFVNAPEGKTGCNIGSAWLQLQDRAPHSMGLVPALVQQHLVSQAVA